MYTVLCSTFPHLTVQLYTVLCSTFPHLTVQLYTAIYSTLPNFTVLYSDMANLAEIRRSANVKKNVN